MSRHLFEGDQVDTMGQLERPASPLPSNRNGNGNSNGHARNGNRSSRDDLTQQAKDGSTDSHMYMALLRLPLAGVFR